MRIEFNEVAQKIQMINEDYKKLMESNPDSLMLFGLRVSKDSSFVSMTAYEIIDFQSGKQIEYFNGIHNESIMLKSVMDSKVNRYPNYTEAFCFIHQLKEAIEKVIKESQTPLPSQKQRLAALSYIINEMKE